ncbi:MAG: T9SS type A sorting domain-containing protein [Bacteroidia bacterium]|nr:T9SS type A sorting domain-containing protein [Bacteroidia bacterium]
MKKIFILLIIILLIKLNDVFSQVPNGSFENWNNITFYQVPDSFQCNAFQSYTTFGTTNVIKTTDSYSGNFALQLVTMGSTGNFIPGELFLGQPAGQNINGGVPFNERPDTVKFYAKFHIQTGDTSLFYVIFKKATNIIGYSILDITGVQNIYHQYVNAITWVLPAIVMPDTMSVVLVSSNPGSTVSGGDTLTIDDISLVGSVLQIPNSSFEYWTPVGSEEPEYWLTSNVMEGPGQPPSVTKTNDAYDGQYAIRLENIIIQNSDTLSFITNGHIGPNGPVGGMPVTHNPDKLSFYYKYTPVGADSATVFISSYRWDAIGDSAILIEKDEFRLPAAAVYTYYEIQAAFDSLPVADTVNISFSAGNVDVPNAFVGVGSVLLVDKIDLTFKTTIGVPEIQANNLMVNVFPNPTSGSVRISVQNGIDRNYLFRLFDSFGKCVMDKNLEGSEQQVDLSRFSDGFYTYQVINSGGQVTGKLGIIRH